MTIEVDGTRQTGVARGRIGDAASRRIRKVLTCPKRILSLGIKVEGSKGRLTNPGSPGKMAVKTRCVRAEFLKHKCNTLNFYLGSDRLTRVKQSHVTRMDTSILTRWADDGVDAALPETARNDGPRDVVTWRGPQPIAGSEHRAAIVPWDEVLTHFSSCNHSNQQCVHSNRHCGSSPTTTAAFVLQLQSESEKTRTELVFIQRVSMQSVRNAILF